MVETILIKESCALIILPLARGSLYSMTFIQEKVISSLTFPKKAQLLPPTSLATTNSRTDQIQSSQPKLIWGSFCLPGGARPTSRRTGQYSKLWGPGLGALAWPQARDSGSLCWRNKDLSSPRQLSPWRKQQQTAAASKRAGPWSLSPILCHQLCLDPELLLKTQNKKSLTSMQRLG